MMKQKPFVFKKKWLAALLMLISSSAMGVDVQPCLIFTGYSADKQCIDLSAFNRISFDEDGFTVSSSKDDSTQEINLPYSLYNRFAVGDDVPNMEAGIGAISIQDESQLEFLSESNSLKIISASTNSFEIGIFSLNGVLVAKSSMHSHDLLSLNELMPNVYVAVASDGNIQLTLKFIIR
ncbi:MAG: T9SS type A sorting domain-containing protein [Clostridium sp.]|nr:T9SS type A sorting domain-containing protein [Clostridium sp.]